MMYKLLHKLFGWDYIVWTNTAASGLARVHVAPDGTIYYWRYKSTSVIDKIYKPDQVIWLTCKSSDYLIGE